MINALIAAWANERLCVVQDRPENGWPGTAELYGSYAAWCQRKGRPVMTNTYFTRRLAELDGIEIRRHARGRVVVGAAELNQMPDGEWPKRFIAKSRKAEQTPFQAMFQALTNIEQMAQSGAPQGLIAGIAGNCLNTIDPYRIAGTWDEI